MDNFIILCFVAVFAALVEFACINFIDTFVKNTKQRIEAEKAKEEEETQKAKQKMEEAIVNLSEFSVPALYLGYDKSSLQLPVIQVSDDTRPPNDFLLNAHIVNHPERNFPTLATSEEDEFDDIDELEENNLSQTSESSTQSQVQSNRRNTLCHAFCLFSNCLIFIKNLPQKCRNATFKIIEDAIEAHWGPLIERNFYINTTEVIWKIDSYARKMFPLLFLILQLIYWTSYLYIM